MNTTNLLDELGHRPILSDGAMGTQLIARGLAPGECSERWNLERADKIREIHRAYLDAGCDCVTTNTFGATDASLERHGLVPRAAELNRAGAAIAREAAGGGKWVLGDIGPFGGFLEPVGEALPEDVLAMFTRQANALRQGGCDAIIIETMVDAAEMELAIAAAKSVADWPVLATFAFNPVGQTFRTITGLTAAAAMSAAVEAGADVVGANCGTGIDLAGYVRLAKELVGAAGDVPVILQPNAGAPEMQSGKAVYGATPDDMAKIVSPLLDAGVRMIGGCCGTTPDHLRAMKSAARQQH